MHLSTESLPSQLLCQIFSICSFHRILSIHINPGTQPPDFNWWDVDENMYQKIGILTIFHRHKDISTKHNTPSNIWHLGTSLRFPRNPKAEENSATTLACRVDDEDWRFHSLAKSFRYPKIQAFLVSSFPRWNDPSLNDENLFRHLLPSLLFHVNSSRCRFSTVLLFQVWLFIENPGQIES